MSWSSLNAWRNGEVLSKPQANALKFRAPDGTVAEIVSGGGFEMMRDRETGVSA